MKLGLGNLPPLELFDAAHQANDAEVFEDAKYRYLRDGR